MPAPGSGAGGYLRYPAPNPRCREGSVQALGGEGHPPIWGDASQLGVERLDGDGAVIADSIQRLQKPDQVDHAAGAGQMSHVVELIVHIDPGDGVVDVDVHHLRRR